MSKGVPVDQAVFATGIAQLEKETMSMTGDNQAVTVCMYEALKNAYQNGTLAQVQVNTLQEAARRA